MIQWSRHLDHPEALDARILAKYPENEEITAPLVGGLFAFDWEQRPGHGNTP